MSDWRNMLWRDEAAVDRFWRYALPMDGCWPWAGPVNRRGYARLQVQRNRVRKSVRAYCLGWQIANGADWPDGALARHSCDNPSCVNPAHITPGTQLENMADSLARGRHALAKATHCKSGHALSGDNLIVYGSPPKRGCITCRRAASLRHWRRNFAKEPA